MTTSRSFALSSVAIAEPPGACPVVANEKRVEGLTVTGLQRTAKQGDVVLSARPRSGVARRSNTRRYSIEVKDAATEKSVYTVAADWTEYQKHVAVSRIMRLTGPADDSN